MTAWIASHWWRTLEIMEERDDFCTIYRDLGCLDLSCILSLLQHSVAHNCGLELTWPDDLGQAVASWSDIFPPLQLHVALSIDIHTN